MKSVVVLIGVGIVIAMMGGILGSMRSADTDSRTDTASITTDVGETTAPVTLQEAPWKELTASVSTISSDEPLDHPIAASVTDKVVTASGLSSNTTRTLSVVYEYDALQGYTGASSISGVTPLMVWVGIIMVVVGVVISIVKGRF